MADNPKSLASLADELEAMAKKPQYYPRSPAVLMAAAAALRAPTKSFIVDLIERLEKAVSALDGTMPSTVQTLRASIVLLSKLRFSDEQEAALAKTISAVGDALRAPTLAAPSPSDEVTAEMLEAALKAYNHLTPGPIEGVWSHTLGMKKALKAALKARKPADDGAGQ